MLEFPDSRNLYRNVQGSDVTISDNRFADPTVLDSLPLQIGITKFEEVRDSNNTNNVAKSIRNRVREYVKARIELYRSRQHNTNFMLSLLLSTLVSIIIAASIIVILDKSCFFSYNSCLKQPMVLKQRGSTNFRFINSII